MRQLLETLASVKERTESTSSSSEQPAKPVKPVKSGKPSKSTSPVRTPPHVPRIIRKVGQGSTSECDFSLFSHSSLRNTRKSMLSFLFKTSQGRRKVRSGNENDLIRVSLNIAYRREDGLETH